MIDADVAASRQTAVFRAAMRHGNKIRPSAIVPGHRRIRDFSRSFRAVYRPDRRLPLTTVRGEEPSDGFRRGERVRGGPDDRLGQVLGPAGPGVPAIVNLLEHYGRAGCARRGGEPVHNGSVPAAGQGFRRRCAG